MSDTVIYPLSDETGQEILAALLSIDATLKRIARNMSGTGDTATYSDGTLEISGNATVENGELVTTATYENGELSF